MYVRVYVEIGMISRLARLPAGGLCARVHDVHKNNKNNDKFYVYREYQEIAASRPI